MKVIIDRFEEDCAVVELGEKMYNIPRALLPEAHEGDTVEISVLEKPAYERREAHAVFERLRNKRSGEKRNAPESASKSLSDNDSRSTESSCETPDKTASQSAD